MLFLLGILILSQIAYAGVTNPLPTELNLMKGESGRFKFQIQTVASNQELECDYFQETESPLEVVFDPPHIVVPAGTVREVRGTVTVPKDVDFTTYEETFCISCKPVLGEAGTAVKIDTCGLPIKVNVVSEEQRDTGKENMYVPPKPFPEIYKVIIIVGAAAIAIIVYYLLRLQQKKKPKKKKAKAKTAKAKTKKKR